jgi:hypothetical protein
VPATRESGSDRLALTDDLSESKVEAGIGDYRKGRTRMFAKLRSNLTYANVMVTILAVMVIGGGGAYAAAKLKLKNSSVTTPKIADGAVTNPKLAPGAVTGDKVAGGSLTGSQIDASTLGTVPNSTHSANADNAAQLGGAPASAFLPSADVQRIDWRPTGCTSGCGPQPLLNMDGFSLSGTCSSASVNLNLTAVPADNESANVEYIDSTAHSSGFQNFGPLIQESAGPGNGTIVLRDDAHTITIVIHTYHAGNNCEIFGNVVRT